MDAWCAATGEPRGEAVALETIWRLSQLWYGDRMEPAYNGRTLGEAQALLARAGLRGPFWQAEGAS